MSLAALCVLALISKDLGGFRKEKKNPFSFSGVFLGFQRNAKAGGSGQGDFIAIFWAIELMIANVGDLRLQLLG